MASIRRRALLLAAVLRVRYHEVGIQSSRAAIEVAARASDETVASIARERGLQEDHMAKGNNAQKKETKKPKKDSAKNGKKK